MRALTSATGIFRLRQASSRCGQASPSIRTIRAGSKRLRYRRTIDGKSSGE